MAGMPVIVQYRAENVNLNNINIRGFSNAMADIKIFGGANRPKKVTISNVNIVESSKISVSQVAAVCMTLKSSEVTYKVQVQVTQLRCTTTQLRLSV